MTGNFENFDGGGLNGDVPGLVTGNTQITWPFADVGSFYTTMKAIYLSPQFFGFDAGVSFEPNTGNVSINNSCGSGSPVGANFVNAVGSVHSRLAAPTATAPPTGLRAAVLRHSNAKAPPPQHPRRAAPLPRHLRRLRHRRDRRLHRLQPRAGQLDHGVAFTTRAAPFTGRLNFDGLNVGDFGVALTYGGLSVGGKYQFGRFNGQWQLAPKGVADGEAILGGASYTVGPLDLRRALPELQERG